MHIYLIRNDLNGKCYVGQTRQSVSRRLLQHRNAALHPKNGSALGRAIAKHGWDNFSRSVLQVCESQAQMDGAERQWIKFYESLAPKGYNIDLGGQGGAKFSDETKEKIAASKRGKPRSELTKQRVSEGLRGKKLSPESIARRTAKQTGLCRSQAVRDRLRVTSTGRRHSEETKARISNTKRGVLTGRRGVKNPGLAGENAGRAKLDWTKVREIRRRLALKEETQRALAKEFGVSQGVIQKIGANLLWEEPTHSRTECGMIQLSQ